MFERNGFVVVVGNPLGVVVGRVLDCGWTVEGRSQIACGDNVLNLLQVQHAFRARAKHRQSSFSELADTVRGRAVGLLKRERASIPRHAHRDFLGRHFCSPEKIERVINLCQVSVRPDVRANSLSFLVPDAVQIVAHDIEEVDVLLHTSHVEAFHVVLGSRQCDRQAVPRTESCSKLLRQRHVVLIIRRSATAVT